MSGSEVLPVVYPGAKLICLVRTVLFLTNGP